MMTLRTELQEAINTWSARALRVNETTMHTASHINIEAVEHKMLQRAYLQALCRGKHQHPHIYPHVITITRNAEECQGMYLVSLMEALTDTLSTLEGNEINSKHYGAMAGHVWSRAYATKEDVDIIYVVDTITRDAFKIEESEEETKREAVNPLRTLLYIVINNAHRLYRQAVRELEKQSSTWKHQVAIQVASAQERGDSDTYGYEQALQLACSITGHNRGDSVETMLESLREVLPSAQFEYTLKRLTGAKVDDSKNRNRTKVSLLEQGIVQYNTMYNRYYI